MVVGEGGRERAETIASVVGYRGRFLQGTGKPDGTPRKAMVGSRLRALGWAPQAELAQGIVLAYADFRERLGAARAG